jgi:hypothetical protein
MRPAWPPPFAAGPLLGPPAGDLGLVALGGPAGGPLRAPVMPAQQPPHVPGVVADAGEPPDHLGDPGQGPQVGVEPVGLRPCSRARSTRRQSRLVRREGGPSGPDRPARRGRLGASGCASGWPSGGRPQGGGRSRPGAGPGRTGGRLAGGAPERLWGSGAGCRRRRRGGLGHDHRLTTREASEVTPFYEPL